tara:strand:- start:25591 stop:25854 length:264 start_codon:yes stop_codon:yes gene_type:complete
MALAGQNLLRGEANGKSLGVNKINNINDIILPYCGRKRRSAAAFYTCRNGKLPVLEGILIAPVPPGLWQACGQARAGSITNRADEDQ